MRNEIGRIVSRYAVEKDELGGFDLESFEMGIRSAMHNIGGRMLEMLINADGGDGGGGGKIIDCEKGHKYEFVGYRDKKLLTVLGEVVVRRAYYWDKECGRGYCPKDLVLDIEGTSYSCGVRRLMSRVGAYRSFGVGHQDLYELADIRVSAKEVERVSEMVGRQVEGFQAREAEAALSEKVVPIRTIPQMYICMDGTGVPVVRKETEGRQGKAEGGQAKTREAKLGCIFTQTDMDQEGRPVRDEESTSYTGAIESSEVFGKRIYEEAKRRGLSRASDVCVLGDGALWIWNIADEHFYGATQIVDLYHAREHYWNVARACFGQDKEKLSQWTEKRRIELDDGKVEEIVEAIRLLRSMPGCDKEACEREIGYFDKNVERMRYGNFKGRGLFVGSGVVEAGCRTIIGQRLKQSGMHWSVKGANSIIALRCCLLSNRWEDFWENRAAA
jgi:hypothetical protein